MFTEDTIPRGRYFSSAGYREKWAFVRVRSDAAEAAQTRRGSGSGDHFENVSGKERRYGKSEDSCRGLVGKNRKPSGSGKQNQHTADGGRSHGRGESALANAAAKMSGEGRGGRIGEKIAARGAEDVEESDRTDGAEDGQASGAFEQIKHHCRSGDAG